MLAAVARCVSGVPLPKPVSWFVGFTVSKIYCTNQHVVVDVV
jgi:hypothetical protein